MELKKSYKGYVIWMIAFCIANVGVMFLPIKDKGTLFRMILHICTIGITLLTLIIYHTEYVYWYSGISYEDANHAGSQRRKKLAWNIFKQFGLCTFILLVFSIFAHISHMSYWIDFAVVMIGIVVCAITTIRFKL